MIVQKCTQVNNSCGVKVSEFMDAVSSASRLGGCFRISGLVGEWVSGCLSPPPPRFSALVKSVSAVRGMGITRAECCNCEQRSKHSNFTRKPNYLPCTPTFPHTRSNGNAALRSIHRPQPGGMPPDTQIMHFHANLQMHTRNIRAVQLSRSLKYGNGLCAIDPIV